MPGSREYKRGVYRVSENASSMGCIAYYNGEKFYLPGWEIGLHVSDVNSTTQIRESDILELLWEDTAQ